jgi:hypothetical protein
MMQKMDNGFANLANAEPTRNINTMSTSSAGNPPYQLDCGNGGATHAVTSSNRSYHKPARKNNSRSINRVQPKTISRVRTSITPINKSKIPPKSVAQTKSAAKRPAKSKNFHRAKTDIKAKVARKAAPPLG